MHATVAAPSPNALGALPRPAVSRTLWDTYPSANRRLCATIRGSPDIRLDVMALMGSAGPWQRLFAGNP